MVTAGSHQFTAAIWDGKPYWKGKLRNSHEVQFGVLACYLPNMSHGAGQECKADGMGSYNGLDLCTQQMASTGYKKITDVLVGLGAQQDWFQMKHQLNFSENTFWDHLIVICGREWKES